MNILLLILAAGPQMSIAPESAPASADPLTPLYAMLGLTLLTQLIAGIFGIVRWLGHRTVEREDKDKESVQKQLEEHDERFDEHEKAYSGIDKSVSSVQTEMKQVLSAVESMKGTVSEIREAVDKRIEKQADHYRQQEKDSKDSTNKLISDLEFKMRQEMMRSNNDAVQMAVQKMEQHFDAKFQQLEDRLTKRRKSR